MYTRTRNWLLVGIVAMVLILVLATPLKAPVWAGEHRSGQYLVVGVDEVIEDDLFCAGETITIDGVVKGDVLALASEIRINGTVEGDLMAMARSIIINGAVKDDARLAAYELQVAEKGRVGDDFQGAAFSLNTRAGSQVGGDVYVVSYQTQFDGQLIGNLYGAMGALVIGGEITGDVTVRVGEPDPEFAQLQPLLRLSPVPVLPPGLRVKDSAQIRGKLTYTSLGEAAVARGASISPENLIHVTPPPAERPRERERVLEVRGAGLGWDILRWVIAQARWFISLLLVSVLLVWLAPLVVPQAAIRLEEKPWPSLGWGCLAEIVILVAFPILFALIIGGGLLLGLLTLGGLQGAFISMGLLVEGLIGVAFVIITSYVTKIVVGYVFGRWLLLKAHSPQAASPLWPAVIGIVLFVLVRSIPILGWLIGLAATLFGLGALWLWLQEQPWWPWQPKVLAPALGPEPPPAEPVTSPAEETTLVEEVLPPPAEEGARVEAEEIAPVGAEEAPPVEEIIEEAPAPAGEVSPGEEGPEETPGEPSPGEEGPEQVGEPS